MSDDVAMEVPGDNSSFDADDVAEEAAVDPDPTKVAYTTTDFDVEGLVRRLGRNDIRIPTFGDEEASDHEEAPIETARFQRPFVWSKAQMDRFIESLLLGYPIPGIFLVQQSDRSYLVLDGQQRLRTLNAFFEGVVNKKEFALQYVGEKFKGLTYKTLGTDQRRMLENTFIQATIVQPDGSPSSLDAVYQVFERLNAGGTQLTPHEIRIALYAGAFVEWITQLSRSEEWRNLYGPPARHLRDQELILRVIALVVSPGTYKRPLKKFLNDFMAEHRNLNGLDRESLDLRFRRAAQLVAQGPGPQSIRPSGTAVNAALTEAVIVGLMRGLEASQLSPAQVEAGMARLLAETELPGVIERATADEDSVRKRIALATRAFAR
ncbi:DUF262 domain-containing protein [Cellulosimicrobium sp. Marseille-Q8652]